MYTSVSGGVPDLVPVVPRSARLGNLLALREAADTYGICPS